MIGFVMTINLSQLKIAQLQSKNKRTLLKIKNLNVRIVKTFEKSMFWWSWIKRKRSYLVLYGLLKDFLFESSKKDAVSSNMLEKGIS